MGAIQHFATRDVPPERRLAYWNECARATFAGMTVDAAQAPFAAELCRWQLGGLVLARPRSQGSLVRRRGAAAGPEQLVVHLPRRGLAEQRQRGHDIVLRPGDLSVCTVADALELRTEDHEMLVAQVPRALLAARLPGLDDRLARLAPAAMPAVRLLHDFVLSLWRGGEAGAGDPDWEETAAGVLCDLLALALRGGPPPASSRDLARLRRLVEARLGDPELGVTILAAELGLSPRRVQQLFAGAGATPGGYILEQRLARAAELLAGDPGRSVTGVAFDLGFNDSAYFSRRFSRRHGIGPAAWRAGHRAPASR